MGISHLCVCVCAVLVVCELGLVGISHLCVYVYVLYKLYASDMSHVCVCVFCISCMQVVTGEDEPPVCCMSHLCLCVCLCVLS